MALSDSASSSIPKKASTLNVYDGAVVSRKQTLKKRSTLTVVRDT